MPAAVSHNPIKRLILIASSTGGPRVLRDIFSQIGPLDATIVISQHITVNADKLLRDSLGRISGIETIIPIESEKLQNGKIYISPCDEHLTIDNKLTVHMNNGPQVNYVRPSADVTMMSVSAVRGVNILAIVLTGIGRDGTDGVRYIKSIGGKIIAQDPKSCVIHEMPTNAIETGCVDAVMTPHDIKKTLMKFSKPVLAS